MKTVVLFLIFCAGLAAQTCIVTSPTSGQLIQAAQPLQLTASVSSAPSAFKLIWYVDFQRWRTGYYADQHQQIEDYGENWQGAWTVTWYTGLNGDGLHTVSGVLYDIFGTQLATCAAVNFTVRVEGMSNQSINAIPTSGTGSFGFLTFNGQSNGNGSPAVDGYVLSAGDSSPCGASSSTSQSGGWQLRFFNTACFPNGVHQILAGTAVGNLTDPYLLGVTFISSNVSGNNISVPNHYSIQGGVVTLSTTGTLPSPLVPGTQWHWATSATNPTNTITLGILGGVMTFTCSTPCSVSNGTPVFIQNIQSTNQTTGLANCDGYYTNTTNVSSTVFTVPAPAGCPDNPPGTTGSGTNNVNLDVYIHPYFVNYIDANTISVSATPGGSTVTLTNGGSGTHTVTQRLRSPYWTANPNLSGVSATDHVSAGGLANVIQLVTFSNGNAPMEIEVPYWEMHMVAGSATQSVCPKIKNTDLSFTTVSCNASGLTYTEVDDGGLSGVCSVDSSGNVTPIMAGWCQVQVACTACAGGGVTLKTVIVYVQVHNGSITFPTFTTCGTIATSFTPGPGCRSFFPLSVWQLTVRNATVYNNTPASRPLWIGPMMQEANLNSSTIPADPSGLAFGDPQSTTCYSSTWPSTVHSYEASFAAQYGTYFEADITSTHSNEVSLGALLNNLTYNRQGCFTGFLSQLASEGRTWRTTGVDEINNYLGGSNPFRNPSLGSTSFPSIIVSGGVATYNVGESFNGVWSQATGAGSWIKIAGATVNTCLNGWFPVTGITTDGNGNPISFTTYSSCANGTYTESAAQLYHYWVNAGVGAGTGAVLAENAGVLPRKLGTPNADQNVQNWDATYFTQISVSGGVATFTMPSHGIANGQAIRVWGSVNNLNNLAPITYIDSSHFRIAYNGALVTVPSNGTYTSANDPGLYVTVDANFPGGTPLLSLRNLITSVPGHAATTWGIIGFTYNVGNPAVRNWEGSTAGADATFDYIPQGPTPVYGPDASVWQWATYPQSSSGLATRGYQLQPRAMLWSGGFLGGNNVVQYCHSFQFNPACDRPATLYWRPEGTVAQMIGMLTLNVSGLRLYNFMENMTLLYSNVCCGWQTQGIGTGGGMNPYIGPKQWAAMAHTNTLIKLREDTELQPAANKPYLGPLFLTDAHTSSVYGNELKILCASEMPYGAQTITLPRISGGSMLKYTLTGYVLQVSLLPGNPATDTAEFCATPGQTTTYVGQPAGVNVLDNITFAPPSPLPLGASKFLVQVGYYPRAMQDDPVTDCTSACTIAIDHHNTAAWYRVIYANSNNLPLSVGEPAQIVSQGLN